MINLFRVLVNGSEDDRRPLPLLVAALLPRALLCGVQVSAFLTDGFKFASRLCRLESDSLPSFRGLSFLIFRPSNYASGKIGLSRKQDARSLARQYTWFLR